MPRGLIRWQRSSGFLRQRYALFDDVLSHVAPFGSVDSGTECGNGEVSSVDGEISLIVSPVSRPTNGEMGKSAAPFPEVLFEQES